MDDTIIKSSLRCATWSQHQHNEGWVVQLHAVNSLPEDLTTRLSFAVVSLQINSTSQNVQLKSLSREKYVDLKLFKTLLRKGFSFTKLELSGDFFTSVSLCPVNATPSFRIEKTLLNNLRILTVEARVRIAVKGNDYRSVEGEEYRRLHATFLDTCKARAAQNLWYIFSSFHCPHLQSLEIKDLTEWEDPELNGYWSQPLFGFLQRHANTLKTLKLSPLTAMTNGRSDMDDLDDIPSVLENILFWIRPHLHCSTLPSSLHSEKELQMNIEMDEIMEPWRQFLYIQRNLKSIAWITDSLNPWPIGSHDFVSVCKQNNGLESCVLFLHCDKRYRESHGLSKDPAAGRFRYQINGNIFNGMSRLKLLSVGCHEGDPHYPRFTFHSLDLLPMTLEVVHLSGIRIMEPDLIHVVKLPVLKELVIVQPPRVIIYTDSDCINGNAEGVTITVLKTIVNYARRLEKMKIIGFPIPYEKYAEILQERKRTRNAESGDCFGSLCESSLLCLPNVEITFEQSLALLTRPTQRPLGIRNRNLRSIAQYGQEMQNILRSFLKAGFVVRDSPPLRSDILRTMITLE